MKKLKRVLLTEKDTRGEPKLDGSGRGAMLNAGRGGCKPIKRLGLKRKLASASSYLINREIEKVASDIYIERYPSTGLITGEKIFKPSKRLREKAINEDAGYKTNRMLAGGIFGGTLSSLIPAPIIFHRIRAKRRGLKLLGALGAVVAGTGLGTGAGYLGHKRRQKNLRNSNYFELSSLGERVSDIKRDIGKQHRELKQVERGKEIRDFSTNIIPVRSNDWKLR
ncbi:MAG: hypothetical protein WCY30_00145 [Candidatus Neomarinimicrobiota bacterium]|jgi:hypothetical protein